jgi:hypothetical protein
MYQSNLTCCIKANGRILRESGDLVTLPFQSEYSVLIRNLNSVRVQVSVSVDGTNATEGTRLIIAPNSSLELERFIKGGNLNAGNKFRFIERSADVEKHRGIGSDDGLVRVEAWRELVTVRVPVPRVEYYDYPAPTPRPYWPLPHWPYYGPYYGSNTTGGIVSGQGAGDSILRACNFTQSANTCNVSADSSVPEVERSASDIGITVPGSESRQQFYSTSGFPLETQSTVIVLRLRGQVGMVPVVKPITSSVKPKCGSCGKVSKSGVEFCPKCGTALVAYA